MARYLEFPIDDNGKGLRIGIAVARFNQDICDGLLSGAINELHSLGVAAEDITVCSVPGALEIPLVLQTLADDEENSFDALIALGAVIRGETYHFEVVSNDSCRAVMDVQLTTGVPIANGILTTEDDDQALARMHDKGADCARCAVEMARLHARIRSGQAPQPEGTAS
ncbi:MAG: 6,7-dimethyl-8-ribityllumazine synthase [Pseudomonadota bacterium]|jgi:6,7-dimethyl-8-ribityllumazine synthase